MMDTHELAWAAGFFDGEGCTSRNWRDGRFYPRAAIQQTDPEVLERFKSAVGKGAVGNPSKRKNPRPNARPLWNYTVSGYSGTKHVIELLWPWLGTIKREQAAKVLSDYLSQPPLLPRGWQNRKDRCRLHHINNFEVIENRFVCHVCIGTRTA